MASIAIIYGSSTGNTTTAAQSIQKALAPSESELIEVSTLTSEMLAPYQYLILGTSTWGYGDLQDDWDMKLSILQKADLNGKTVAFFGLGDQGSYPDTFVNGMGTLYDTIQEKDVSLIGFWPTAGYEFETSLAVRDGQFVGLALDTDNQDEQTNERIQAWVEQIKKQMK